MTFNIITLFPQLFDGIFSTSMIFKARQKGLVKINYVNLRDFGKGPRKQVDDTPYGGGDGMLLKPEPVFEAVDNIKSKFPKSKTVLMTPKGERLNQQLLKKLASDKNDLIIICARYEGYDERIATLADYQISLGDFVLTGGEIPAMAVVDGISRLLSGVLGGEKSAEIESFSQKNYLEYSQYTRPVEFRGLKVPEVLLNGNHAEIAKWRENSNKNI